MLNGLDLFSGIAGLSIALKKWVRPLAYCETDPFCHGVLLSRMAMGDIQAAPIYDNVSTFNAGGTKGGIDIIYGGFPCQDISIAGLGKGLEGERSGLFFEIVRLAKEIQPTFIFLENVPAITTRGGVQVVESIAEMGYDCRWCIISAEEWVDQKRDRWFLLAKLNSKRWDEGTSETIQPIGQSSLDEKPCDYKLSNMEGWGAFARGVRKTYGVSHRTHRIRVLGNAVVPQQAKKAFEILMGLNKD